MNQITTVANNHVAPANNLEKIRQLERNFISFIDASERTAEAYSRNLRRFFVYLQENHVQNPKREDVIAYRESLFDRGLENTTVQAYLVAVKLFFKWTGAEGIYPNIADHVKGAKVSRTHKKDYITSAQAKKLLGSIDPSQGITQARDQALIALLITTGLRTIEIHRALVEDIRALGNETVLYIQGKGKADKSDFVKVPEQVEDMIRNYHQLAGIRDSKAPLFQSTSNNSQGQTLSTRSIRGIVKGHLRAIGIDSDRITAHSMRHTSVTLALIGGATIQEAQQHARHKSINTTMIYAHNLEKAQNQCAQVVSDALFT